MWYKRVPLNDKTEQKYKEQDKCNVKLDIWR